MYCHCRRATEVKIAPVVSVVTIGRSENPLPQAARAHGAAPVSTDNKLRTGARLTAQRISQPFLLLLPHHSQGQAPPKHATDERATPKPAMAPQPLGAASAWDEEEVSEGSPAASRLRHRHAGKGADDDAEAGGGEHDASAGEPASVERVFADKAVPSWREQLTFRALAVSALLAVMFSVIVMKLNLTTGIIPSLNVSAGLLGFFFVRMWTAAVERMGLLRQPFTRQENTVIQTCVVSAYGIAFSGTVTAAVLLGPFVSCSHS
jgi:hypothetical protein